MSGEEDIRASMQDRLKQLGEQFLQRTSREAASMQGLLAQLRNGDASAFDQLRHLSHKIHGTGATLGFNSISDYAGKVELLLDRHCAADMTRDAQAFDRLSGDVKSLESEVEQILKTRSNA